MLRIFGTYSIQLKQFLNSHPVLIISPIWGDRKLQLAIERCVEVIGEAAKNISETFKGKHPEIPWRSIVAQRNVIAHEYGEIKQDRMWALVEKKIPELAALIKPLVPPLPPEDE